MKILGRRRVRDRCRAVFRRTADIHQAVKCAEAVAEADFALGGMNVDIDILGLALKLQQDCRGLPAGFGQAAIGFCGAACWINLSRMGRPLRKTY